MDIVSATYIYMIKKILQKIGASENLILKSIAQFMRWPYRSAQLQQLKFYKDRSIINLIRAIQKDGGSLMWPTELVQIYHCVSSAKKLSGDFAEVGVYLGRSAKLICEAKGDRTFHLFDTFEGLPKSTSWDPNIVYEKMYAADLDLVKSYLDDYKNIIFHSGLFPKSAEPVKNKLFAFVHLDVDLYRSTLECLKFFYPRMEGGVLSYLMIIQILRV